MADGDNRTGEDEAPLDTDDTGTANHPRVSRREFLKTVGLVGAGFGAFGMTSGYAFQHLDDRVAPEDGMTGNVTANNGECGFTWEQTHVDTSWVEQAEANGSWTVETVTNLDASGPGSFAAALEAAEDNDNTLIVFEVGGVIDNGGTTFIRSRADNVYIAGQTAPSPGITVVNGGGLRIHGSNTIVQHMSFLPGDNVDEPHKSRAITINEGTQNNLIDHCTAGWAPDTNIDLHGPASNYAVINSINAEALNDSSHPEAPHGYGLLIYEDTQAVTYIGNLHAHNWKRNIKPNENCEIVYANNYIHNWGARVWHGSADSTECDWIGCIIEAGDDTDLSSGAFDDSPGIVYWSDNTLIPEDTPMNDGDIDYVSSPMHLPPGLSESDLVPSSGLKDFILPMAGPRPADRPPVEQRIIDDVANGGGQIIDHQSDVGGYPDYTSNTRSLSPPSTGVLEWLQQYTQQVI